MTASIKKFIISDRPTSSDMKIEIADLYETLVSIYETTRRHTKKTL